jgi:hypothetical protein
LEILALYQEFNPESCEDGGQVNINAAKMLVQVSASRYLAPRIHLPRNRYWLEEGLAMLYEKGFRQQIRVSHDSFHFILRMIVDHPIFTNNSPNEQMPVEHQLYIALWRFGRFGNGASLIDAGRLFSISKGTVFKATK